VGRPVLLVDSEGSVTDVARPRDHLAARDRWRPPRPMPTPTSWFR
jgi:hypothetical protein